MASATAIFTQDSYNLGNTIRCDFTWTGAAVCSDPGYGWAARMRITDSTGNIEYEAHTSTASSCSSNCYSTYLPTQPGTYYGRITIWDLSGCRSVLNAVDTCIVVSAGVTLTLASSPAAGGTTHAHPACCAYNSGDYIAVHALPNSGYIFDHWADSLGHAYGASEWDFWITQNLTCTAYFVTATMACTTKAYDYPLYGCTSTIPPTKTTFTETDTLGAYIRLEQAGYSFNGDILAWEWWHNGTPIWSSSTTLGNYYDWIYYCLNWQLGTPGTGYIKWFFNGTFICTTNTYTITGTTVIAELNPEPQSVYSTGPYTPNQQDVNIASLSIKNVGTMAGTLSWQCYAHANQTGETLLTSGTTPTDYPPGESVQKPQIVDIPNETGTIPFGVKVKGETQTTWPAWGALGTMIFQNNITSPQPTNRKMETNNIIIGALGAAGLVGLLWYTKKKKMW